MDNDSIKLTGDEIFLLAVVLNEFNKYMPEELKKGKKIDDEAISFLFKAVNRLIPKLTYIVDELHSRRLQTAVFKLTDQREDTLGMIGKEEV